MGIFFWQYHLDPEFPFTCIQFTTLGDRDKLHWHSYLQIALCIDGRGKYIFTDKEYDVLKGDVFIVDNFENHVAVSSPPESIEFLFIIFLPELIVSPGSRIFDYEYLSPFWYDSKTFCNKIDRSTSAAKAIGQIIIETKEIWDKKEVGYKHFADANLKKILSHLLKYYRTNDPQYSSSRVHNYMKLQPALNYINQHFSDNICLNDISEIVHMSESRLRHLFKEVTRIGFKDYITHLRLNEAKRLLLTTDMSISDIIYKVGFSNVYQFYKIFSKHVFMTPAEYRKKYQDNLANEVFPVLAR